LAGRYGCKGAPSTVFKFGRARDRIKHDIVVELGGSISAEDGLGLLRRDEAVHYKPAVEIDLMRTIKRALDPHNLMNPGKMIEV
jgi:FAD/FMN-containing dehydrogenase